ncbi:hypothetical protein M407DRAFT_7785 [Tulasnella calospora MUT 4182]|uniref:Uncharacterized protein n=1 Tax=Tulasnella calospora MUT 4182 TaxID=1051891 RepID=A0A0C3QJS0_9AGAM|nr:hypothetical protein M407DRAFT_7785 [Tulasnella calospora MUT 4182]
MAYPELDFNTDGAWDPEELIGPAIHAPAEIKDIPISEFRVEWLKTPQPYAKNHMVAAVTFAEPQLLNNKKYYSARLSMELGPEKKVSGATKETYKPGRQYFPGVYTVALLVYPMPTRRALHYVTYDLRQGTTIGTLINKVIAKKMHDRRLLEGMWRSFTALLGRVHSHEEPKTPLSDELTQTYLTSGTRTHVRVGRGWWVSYNPVEDQYTPETTYSDARLSHQILGDDDDDDDDDDEEELAP